jgi:hypothetical protein
VRGYQLGENKEVFNTECWALKKEAKHIESERIYDKKIMFGVDS